MLILLILPQLVFVVDIIVTSLLGFLLLILLILRYYFFLLILLILRNHVLVVDSIVSKWLALFIILDLLGTPTLNKEFFIYHYYH